MVVNLRGLLGGQALGLAARGLPLGRAKGNRDAKLCAQGTGPGSNQPKGLHLLNCSHIQPPPSSTATNPFHHLNAVRIN